MHRAALGVERDLRLHLAIDLEIETARVVGGDYYGFIELPGKRLVLAIGDVAGKGMPAAMLMAKLSSDVRYAALTHPDPGAALSTMRRAIRRALGSSPNSRMISAI